ncbi:hypothetical protein LC1Hm_2086 [Halomicrobium sp. LC1Hm]|nr:hypothetical protein LC1Hm_2086 [Halomicrobium sp. LC1Hm]
MPAHETANIVITYANVPSCQRLCYPNIGGSSRRKASTERIDETARLRSIRRQ